MELRNYLLVNNISTKNMSKKVFNVPESFKSVKISKALKNSRASVELEGLTVSKGNDEICRSLLNGEISNEEANRRILKSYGIFI